MLASAKSSLLLQSVFLHQMTPLHVAAETGHCKILRYLIDKGGDINIKDEDGVSSIIM